MVMFSQLRRFEVIDDEGRQARLIDLAVALLDADYPNTRRNNVLAFGTLILITTAVAVMLASQVLDLLGIHLFGS